MRNDIYHVISCLQHIKIYFMNAISFISVEFIFFNPNSGLKKGTLLMISYKAKHPINVNAITKMNFNIVGISRGNINTEPRYKKIICMIYIDSI